MNYPVIQCLSGDCNNGTGVAELEDFHVYRGEFKNGKTFFVYGAKFFLGTAFKKKPPVATDKTAADKKEKNKPGKPKRPQKGGDGWKDTLS